jgi:hypothetical protein
MATETRDATVSEARPGFPCRFDLDSASSAPPVQGRAEWITRDQAYVLVPYGTARSLQQCWRAVAYLPDRTTPGRSRVLRLQAQLVSAQPVHGWESETEGLLLRLTDDIETRDGGGVRTFPAPN